MPAFALDAPRLAMVGVLLLHGPLPLGAASDDSDFHVSSSEAEDYRGTEEEVESNLTDELAIKLRQFDQWTVEGEERSASRSGRNSNSPDTAGSGGAGASQGRVARGGDSASRGATSSETEGEASRGHQSGTSRSEIAATRSGVSGVGDEQTMPNAQSTPVGKGDPTAVAASPRQEQAAGSVPQPPPRGDQPSQEDDVARMIREAAEQETDPDRKKALMEQYEAYRQNQ